MLNLFFRQSPAFHYIGRQRPLTLTARHRLVQKALPLEDDPNFVE
jgi:hypothetical protein